VGNQHHVPAYQRQDSSNSLISETAVQDRDEPAKYSLGLMQNYVQKDGNFSPISLKDAAINIICLNLLNTIVSPKGVPQELVDKMVESLLDHRMFCKEMLSAFQGCEFSKISLSKCQNVDDEWLVHLSVLDCTSFSYMDLSNCWALTRAGLLHIRGMTSLKTMKLRNCFDLEGTALQFLASCCQLREIDLSNWKSIDLIGIDLISKLCCLEKVCLRGCSVDDSAMVKLSSLVCLTQMDLSMCQAITAEGFGVLRNLPHLRKLNVGWCKGVCDFTMKVLSRIPTIEDLCVSHCGITDQGVICLKELGALRILNLQGCSQLTQNAISHTLEKLPHLQELNLSCIPAVQRIPKSLAGHLISLLVGNTGFRDESIVELSGFSCLEILDLDSCRVGGTSAMQMIGTLTNLTSLNLADTDFSDTGIQYLNNLKGLEKLSLYCCNISNLKLGGIRHLSNLKSLNLDVHGITDRGLICLLSLPHLKRLDLFSACLSDDGMLSLLQLSDLEELEVCGGRLTSLGVEYISKLSTLTRLNVSQNSRICDEGAFHLSRLTKLKNLNISYTAVTSAGVRELVPLFYLETLALYGCDIDKVLIENMKANLPCLKCIRI